MIVEQEKALAQMERVVDIFLTSEAHIRPHFIVTGPSGSGKSYLIEMMAEKRKIHFIAINAAQLTKEGTAGNSLSKALSPMMNKGGGLSICFVDEFDKLFISGNTNSELAHEITNGVQNEFLKVLEGKTTSVYGEYGKYVDVPINKVLFIFAGAFNGEEKLTVDRLREFGIKTEFLGRVGLVFNLEKLSLNSMYIALSNSKLLEYYLNLFGGIQREKVINDIMEHVVKVHEKNTLGIRLLNTLLHQYFINGGLVQDEVERVTFQKTLTFGVTNDSREV